MFEPRLLINTTPRRYIDPHTGCEILDFTHCITGKETPQQIKVILMEYESQRLVKKRRLLEAETKKAKKAERLLRANSRLERGHIQATMFYYDRFGKYHSLSNTLAEILTQENRATMNERKDDERIPEWRRETIEWALEQREEIRKRSKDLRTVAEDGTEGDESRSKRMAEFNSEMVPRSWNQVLGQWIINRDEALAEQRKERLIAGCREDRTKLREARMKIKRLEDALTTQERLYQNLRKIHRQTRLECAEAQMESAEGSKTRKRNTKRKRKNEAPPEHSRADEYEEEGDLPVNTECLPFKCLMCSPSQAQPLLCESTKQLISSTRSAFGPCMQLLGLKRVQLHTLFQNQHCDPQPGDW